MCEAQLAHLGAPGPTLGTSAPPQVRAPHILDPMQQANSTPWRVGVGQAQTKP
jgi:hypothetical protein